MKFSTEWLREWVELPADISSLIQKMALAGFECESIDDGKNIAQIFEFDIVQNPENNDRTEAVHIQLLET